MAERSAVPSGPPTATSWEFVTTFAIVLAAVAVLLIADLALARIERRESAAEAEGLYREGRALLGRGEAREAESRFANAYSMERSNAAFQLALADAMLAGNRVDEAKNVLENLLARSETDGAANLAMARVLVRARHDDEARSYYHRAIYGKWPVDPEGRRLQARLELIDLLARERDQSALLAELLPLQDVAARSAPLERRLAHLFVAAGSPSRAIAIFRAMLERSGADADTYAGLGEAALSLGNFRTARADLVEAHRLDPSRANVAPMLAIADSALALDPEQRGLEARERLDRARGLLARTIAVIERCARTPRADSVRRAAAAQLLGRPSGGGSPLRAAEMAITTASDLWSSRPSGCGIDPSPGGEALALIQARLGQ